MRSKFFWSHISCLGLVYPFARARYVKHDVIHKPEVHNASQRRQIKMEPQTQKKHSQNLVKYACVVSEMQADKQTDKQTD